MLIVFFGNSLSWLPYYFLAQGLGLVLPKQMALSRESFRALAAIYALVPYPILVYRFCKIWSVDFRGADGTQ